MKKLLLTVMAFGFSLTTQAATCEVFTSLNNHKNLVYKQVEARFDQVTTVEVKTGLSLSFMLISEAVNPDNTIEYIKVIGADESQCKGQNLFSDKNIYNGVAVTCNDSALAPLEGLAIACRF